MIKVTIPCYYTQTYKTKPPKTILLSLNWYRNAHYHIKNEVKANMTEVLYNQLKGLEKLPNGYKVKYTYYYKTVTSDLPNVGPLASKWLNDVLQSLGIVTNDNVKFLTKELYIAKEDKLNSRVEAIIYPNK